MPSGHPKDLTGLRFFRLVILKRLPNKNGKVIWECQCDCGNTTHVRADRFNQKIIQHTRSCGCLQKEAARKNGQKYSERRKEKPIKDIFLNYRTRARTNNLEFALTFEQFTQLILNSCQYCGLNFSNRYFHPRYRDIYIDYNGIDRIDSLKGYTIENTRTACCQCNLSKSDYTSEEFLNWIKRTYIFNFGVKNGN